MAGAGYKLFNTGDVLTAAQVNTYLQEQAVMRFANSTARTTALSGVLAEGMMSYLDDTNSVEVYNGSAWVSVGSTGDITGVTAGTGISGGGSSGDVTITNSMATAIDAKGDLIVGTGADTFSRLAVSATDGHVLKVKASTSTGLEWGAASSTPTFVGCGVTNSGTQSISNNTDTDLTFNTEDFDTNGFHSTSTNTARMTIPSGYAGYYRVAFLSYWDDNATGHRDVSLNKNGSLVRAYRINPYGRAQSVHYFVLNLAEGDYITISVLQNSGGSLSIVNQTSQFSIQWLGA